VLKESPLAPINLGNPSEFEIIELANIVKEITGSKSKLINHPLPQDDPKQRCPDISSAKLILQWEPTVKLREGIEKTIEYFKKII
jgi:UDP-glucuronate decarboxylase